MAAYIGASGRILKVTANFPTLAGFTACGFAKWKTKNGAYQIVCLFEGVNLNGFIGIGWKPDGHFAMFSDAGVTEWVFATEPAANTWFFWGLTNSGAGSNTLKGYWKNASVAGETLVTVTGDSVVFTLGPAQLSLGSDTEDEWADVVLAGTRIYSAVLTSAELLQESRRYLPYRTANLNRFSPHFGSSSTERVKDYAGTNGGNWTEVGAVTGEDGPPVPWAGNR